MSDTVRTCPACGAGEQDGAYCTACGELLLAAPERGWRDRLRVGVVGCFLGAIALAAAALVVLIVVAAVPDPVALVLSVVAASIPALVYVGLILWLDRYEAEPPRILALCFAWGAIGAILLSIIGGLLVQAALEEPLGADLSALASLVFGAPLIEESFKGMAILVVLFFARDEFDSVLDGLIYGALVGVGFAMTENILYFGQTYLEQGGREFGIIVLARAVLGGLGHPAYTAVTGAAIGWSRARYRQGFMRFLVPILGWAAAVALHTAWNGGLLVTAGLLGEDAGLLEMVAVLSLIVVVPAVLVLYAVARISARHELQMMADELPAEVARGTITPEEFATIVDPARRQQALAAARTRGGRAMRGRQLAFFHTAADLAFRLHHRRRGEQVQPRHVGQEAASRRRLAALRGELQG